MLCSRGDKVDLCRSRMLIFPTVDTAQRAVLMQILSTSLKAWETRSEQWAGCAAALNSTSNGR
jgi:phage baseplate assembly protein W